ncbi:hypothetical protein DAPPUDRAFT_113409 [Daphnia pulex]|uniref:Uncharacterized protein n=1 Tax=Daphnia pulex TaxID=6669 RepID=E9HEY1_DAPPU|nr:hypothetical protein DAPPUDRAFT_113409 [Daphnia pulex]|eukprot:EFX69707.1 hypothetical protein DAPPUDRAFT_113409 [Daphnia pulex]
MVNNNSTDITRHYLCTVKLCHFRFNVVYRALHTELPSVKFLMTCQFVDKKIASITGITGQEGVYEDEDVDDQRNNHLFEEQRIDWSHTKGKSLARTPVKQPRIYPDLTQVVEEEALANDDSEDGDDESIDKAGPRKPIKKVRWPRIKGLTPTRQSTRIKERTATYPESAVIETPP